MFCRGKARPVFIKVCNGNDLCPVLHVEKDCAVGSPSARAQARNSDTDLLLFHINLHRKKIIIPVHGESNMANSLIMVYD